MKKAFGKIAAYILLTGNFPKIFELAEIVDAPSEKNGYSVKTRLFHRGNYAHACYSVSKSVTALGLGILFDRGLVSPEDKIYDYLSEFFPETADEKWKEVTIDSVLRHRVGIKKGFDFDNENAAALWTDDEWLHTLFSEKIDGPNEGYVYSDGNYYIISRIIEKITETDAERFIEEEIFAKMKFHLNAWSRDVKGHTLGGTGLYLRTEDMAKLGLLFVNRGIFEGRRLVSEKWLNLALFTDKYGDNYGYGIRKQGKTSYSITGMRGQGIYFDIEKRRVLAWHAWKRNGVLFACKLFLR